VSVPTLDPLPYLQVEPALKKNNSNFGAKVILILIQTYKTLAVSFGDTTCNSIA